MVYRILLLLMFLCFIPVQAQENLEEIVETKVNEALKNLDWGGIDKYNKQNVQMGNKQNRMNEQMLKH